jgi:hypothetical protein
MTTNRIIKTVIFLVISFFSMLLPPILPLPVNQCHNNNIYSNYYVQEIRHPDVYSSGNKANILFITRIIIVQDNQTSQ